MVRSGSYDSNGMKKGAWSEDEDNKLRAFVLTYGHYNWRLLPKYAGLKRCGKSCRLRWMNHLKPGVKRGNFSKEEEDLIIKLHAQIGNKWSAIAAKLPGRTDNDIKNYWNTRVARRRRPNSAAPTQAAAASSSDHQMLEMDAAFSDLDLIKIQEPIITSDDQYSFKLIPPMDLREFPAHANCYSQDYIANYLPPVAVEEEFCYPQIYYNNDKDSMLFNLFDDVSGSIWDESFAFNASDSDYQPQTRVSIPVEDYNYDPYNFAYAFGIHDCF